MDDEDYWNQALIETLHETMYLSSQLPPSTRPTVPAPAPELATIPPSLPHAAVQLQSAGQRNNNKLPVRDPFISYSPPRILSQRVSVLPCVVDYSNSTAAIRPDSPNRRFDTDKDLEIDRLKKELGLVSKQLLDKEKECSELRKGEKKEAQNKSSHTGSEGRCSTRHASTITDLEPDGATSVNDGLIDSTTGLEDKRSFKTTGVQADLVNHADLSKKLLDIWQPSNYQDLRRKLISELQLVCSADLQILFSFMNTNTTSLEKEKHAAKTLSNIQSLKALESEKVHNLYSAVTKISYGFVNLKSLVEPLLDLCKAENAILVHRSLHVLHVLLEHISGDEHRFEASDNITGEEASSGDMAQFHGFKGRSKTNLSVGDSVYSSNIPLVRGNSDAESSKKSHGDTDKAQPSWDPNWHSLFNLMNEIASRRTEADVKLEAVSIMNIIVMRTDAFTERETFVSKEVLKSISLLLKKEAGLHVRKGAIQLFYLLLNCPKLLARFDSFHEEKKSPASGNGSEDLYSLEAFGTIFEGLAGCLTSLRKTSEDLELCRNVIMILALVASSGNSGYELLSSHKLPQDTNFLMLILHLLVAEMDSEPTEFHQDAEIFKARTLLMREILILLNRLVSASSSSCTILRELTKSRDMASLTVDAATRLSRRRNLLGQPQNSIQRMRDSEITDLARIFKRRVFAFLGDNIS